MSGLFSTIRAAWPVLRGAIARGQLLNPQCDLIEPDPDIVAEYDVEIPMSGGYSLTANVFRSQRASAAHRPMPVVMCAHPYDNSIIPALKKTPLNGPPQQYRLLPQSGGMPRFSTLTSWESPDPDFWVPAGYAVVNLNLPGFGSSGGPASVLSEHQGASFREAIEWVGAQDWCDGNVGLCGVSFLCISQYLAAAVPDGTDTPEALKCIIPWEGVSDLYRDLACRGGVADIGFLNFWWHTEVKESLNNPIEQYLKTEEAIPLEAIGLHPFYDEYWKKKAPSLENIRLPMMICASFSDHELHTFGSFRAYEKASSAKKWLYTHRSGKWAEFYKSDTLALQKDFMDHFLKGTSNRFDDLPPVRVEVRSDREKPHEIRWERTWPLESTEYRKLYLSSGNALKADAETVERETTYDGKTGQTVFEHVFTEPAELTGYFKLKLWVEARANAGQAETPNDLVLCCFLDKRDSQGRSVRFYGSVGQDQDMVSRGYGRASRRELDPIVSTDWNPVPLCKKDEFLRSGDVVPVEIAICPSSTFFDAGERLALIVSSQDIVHAPIFKKDTRTNSGQHVLHFGGRYDAHLLVPRIPSPEDQSASETDETMVPDDQP